MTVSNAHRRADPRRLPTSRRANRKPGIVLETLEQRLVFSTLTVNTLMDNMAADSVLSLRESVLLIESGGDATAALGRALTSGEMAQVDATPGFGTNDTVLFATAIAGGTISLGSKINVSGRIAVDGGAAGMTVTGNSRFMLINASGNVTLDRLTLTGFSHQGADGVMEGEAGRGGAIHNAGTLTINRTTFSENQAVGGDSADLGGDALGGAIYSVGTLTITNSLFVDNTADGIGYNGAAYGGAIVSSGGTLSVTNSTFTGNAVLVTDNGSDTFGAAIYTYGNTLLDFVTVWDNDADLADAQVIVENAPLTITNSIIGRTAGGDSDLEAPFGPTTTGSNNLIQNTGLTGIGVISTADPLLEPLADNGGPTRTMALQDGSPAIDAAGATTVTTDQRGRPRVAGASADVGAYEVHDDVPSVTGASQTTAYVGAVTLTWVATGFPTPTLAATGTLPPGTTFVDNGDGTGTLSGTVPASAVGQYQFQITATNSAGSGSLDVSLTLIEPPSTTGATTVAAAGGSDGVITVLNPDGTTRFTLDNPFPGNTTARRVATGDLTGDGTPDIIVASGPGSRGTVIAYNGTDVAKLTEFSPFEAWTGAIFVASADVDRDGTGDLIVGTGSTKWSRARVRVFSGTDFSLMNEFTAFNAASTLRVAAADLDGDGYAEVIATRGGGAAAKVRVFDGQSIAAGAATVDSEFLAFDNWLGGCFVATGDVNNDGQTDLLVSQAAGTRPYVSVFNGNDNTLQKRLQVTAFNGAPVASRDMNADGYDDVLVVTRSDAGNVLQVFSGADDSILEKLDLDTLGRTFIA